MLIIQKKNWNPEKKLETPQRGFPSQARSPDRGQVRPAQASKSRKTKIQKKWKASESAQAGPGRPPSFDHIVVITTPETDKYLGGKIF